MNVTLTDIIDIKRLDDLMHRFTLATGTVTAILDLEGNILSAAGWKKICTDFFRVNPVSCQNCLKSDTELANALKAGKKYNTYRCHNGLIDVAVPILVKEDHIANLFIGQFLNDEPDIDFFKAQAAKYDFDEEAFLEALGEVPIFTDEEVRLKVDFLLALTRLFGEMGFNKIQLDEVNESLEKKVLERTRQIRDTQIATLNMMQDVNEARLEAEHLNASLSESNTKLERSNQELEQFAYVSSHDLQEPLRKIKNYIELLNARYSENFDERASHYMAVVLNATERMQQLINDLLQLSRITTRGKDFEQVDLNVLLNEVIDTYEFTIKETGAKINYEKLPIVMGEYGQLLQVFQNLIGNAIKFRNADTPQVTIKSEEHKKHYLISVEDNGIGFDPKYADRIFVVFQRLHTRDVYPGTGIGLAICKKVIERHGGKISAESEPGKGSKFILSLPI